MLKAAQYLFKSLFKITGFLLKLFLIINTISVGFVRAILFGLGIYQNDIEMAASEMVGNYLWMSI